VVIDLTSEVGAGRPPVQVAVVDLSGRLVGVAERGSVDLDVTLGPDSVGAYPEPGLPGRVHLVWVGGVCDSWIMVTVAADVRSISIDEGPRPPCDAMAVGRELVLDFSGSVDVPGIEVRRNLGPPSPVPWPPSGSVVVELTGDVEAGRPPAQAAVVDLSGRLIRVENHGTQPLDVMVGPDGIGVFMEAGLPRRVHLVWEGGLCDDEFVVTVAADLRSISVTGERGSPCRLMLVTRELVLDFSGTVDVPTIELTLGMTPSGG
jgi:hypothetical protein